MAVELSCSGKTRFSTSQLLAAITAMTQNGCWLRMRVEEKKHLKWETNCEVLILVNIFASNNTRGSHACRIVGSCSDIFRICRGPRSLFQVVLCLTTNMVHECIYSRPRVRVFLVWESELYANMRIMIICVNSFGKIFLFLVHFCTKR